MNGANAKFSDWIGRFKTALRQDKKRTTMLVVLLMIAGIVIGRLVVSYDPPARASGADKTASNADSQSSGGDTGTAPTPKSARKHRRIDTASIDRNITRDLFWPDTRCFPPSEQDGANNEAAHQAKLNIAQELAEAEQRKRLKQNEHIKSIHTKAKALCLTTTMLGQSPTALINGQVLRTGDLINGFRLKSISSDCCIVVMEGVEVKLQMVE
jgi:hypothetical protein